MKKCYIPKKFAPATLQLIATISGIVEEYEDAGYVLTVRQLYYQLVARDIIPNTLQEYKRAASIINDAKHAGLLDWDMIEDRTRAFIKRSRWQSPSQILQTCADSYHEDLWVGQPSRLFVIIEKEALVGVLESLCKEWDIPILAARGYPSGSVLREFAVTDMRQAMHEGQRARILHLGDHDPSGIDMTRDLVERLELYTGSSVSLTRLALNMDQVEEERPPENPAKVTDSRFAGYAAEYGESSWELDALPPQYLNSLVRRKIEHYVDDALMNRQRQRINDIKLEIQNLADNHNFNG